MNNEPPTGGCDNEFIPSGVDNSNSEDLADTGSHHIYLRPEDGTVVAPEEETSWLMAQGIAPDFGLGSEAEEGLGAATSVNQSEISRAADRGGDSSTVRTMELTPFTEDEDEFERERISASERLATALELEMSCNVGDDDASPVTSSSPVSQPPLGTDSQLVEEHGMGEDCRTFSRELTADEDDWVLEGILRRRVIHSSTKASSDYATFYDDFGSKSSGMKGAGWVEYYCKWKWYDEPTWERRDLLIDEGYLPECDRFDKKVLGRSVALSGKSVVATRLNIVNAINSGPGESDDDVNGEANVRVMRLLYGDKGNQGTKRRKKENATSFGNSRVVEALAGVTEWDIKWFFRKDGMKALRYGTVATQQAIDRFLHTYTRLQNTHRPIVLFHGTQPQNLPSIAQNGLRIPASRHEVKNGAVHGMGIYAAFRPRTASWYGHFTRSDILEGKATHRLFLCVGLVSPNDTDVKVVRDFCVVFSDTRLILPLFAVDACMGYTHHPILSRRDFTLENLLPAAPPARSLDEIQKGFVPKAVKIGLTKTTNNAIGAYNRIAERMISSESNVPSSSAPRVVLDMV